MRVKMEDNETLEEETTTLNEINKAFEDVIYKEKFVDSSKVILKFVGNCLRNIPPKVVPNEPQFIDEDEMEEENVLSHDVTNVLKRLISGLACNKKFARHGCYVTLQALLQIHPEVVPFVISFTDDFYTQEQQQKDVADYMVGHLMVCGALIRSGFIFENKKFVKSIIKKLIFLRETCSQTDPIAGKFLIDLVKRKNNVIVGLVWQELKDKLLMPIKTMSPSLVWLRFVLARDEFICHLQDVPRDFKEETFSVATYIIIGQLLKKLYMENVNIGSMVEDLFQSMALYNMEGEESATITSFLSYGFLPCVKDTKQSPSKVNFGINIARLALPYLTTKEQVEKCLCADVIQKVIAGSAMNVESVRTSINGFAVAIIRHLDSNKDKEGDMQMAALKPLIVSPGSLRFDNVTKTNVLESANRFLNASTVKQLAELLASFIGQPYTPERMTFNQSLSFEEYKLAVIWFSILISNPAIRNSANTVWRANQSAVLMKTTFFRKHSPKMLRDLKGAYQRTLEQINKKLEDQVAAVELQVQQGDRFLKDLEDQCWWDEETKTCWRKVSLRMKKIQKLKKLPQNELMVFRLLYGQMNLHLLFDAPNTMELISELDQCYKRAFESQSYRKEIDDNDLMWADVVVDLLLTLLSKSNHYWRKIVIAVFRNLCPIITPSSLSLISDTINPEKQDEIYESDDEGEMSDEEKTESENGEMEEEENEEEGEEESDEDIESEEDSETEDVDKLVDEGDENLSKKDEKELQILKLREEMLKISNVTIDDVDMDSVPQEELDNFDKKVGALMKEYQKLKASKKKWVKTKLTKDEVTLMHFRIRVCDLLNALVTEAPSPSHLIKLIQPLLLAVNKTFCEKFQEPLRDRLLSIIKELGKVRKFGDQEDSSTYIEEIVNEMESLFSLCKTLSQDVSKEVNICWTFLVRTGLLLLKKEDQNADVLYKAYSKYLESVLSQKVCKIGHASFTGPLKLESSSLIIVLKMLIDRTFYNPSKNFRHHLAMEMIKTIFINEKSMNKISKEEIIEIQDNLRNNVVQKLNAIEDPKQMKIYYLLQLIELLRIFKVFHKHHDELEKSFKWDEIIEAFKSFCSRIALEGFKALRKALDSFGRSLKVQLLSDETKTSNSKEAKKNKKLMKLKAKKEVEVKPSVDEEEGSTSTPKSIKNKNMEKTKGIKRNLEQVENNGGVSKENNEETKTKKRKKSKKKSKRNFFDTLAAPELENFRFSVYDVDS